MGIKAFFDTGRVYYSGDPNESNKWHAGYGGEIYVVPFAEAFIISVMVGFSKEEFYYWYRQAFELRIFKKLFSS